MAEKSGFALSVRVDKTLSTAERQICILKLISDQKDAHVTEALIQWTLPTGKKMSTFLWPVSDQVWASRLDLQSQPGQHRLTVLMISEGKGKGVGKIHEQLYTLDLPAGTLRMDDEHSVNMESPVSLTGAAPVKPKETKKGFQLSLPVLALGGGVVILMLAFVIAGGLVVYRRAPFMKKLRAAKPQADAEPAAAGEKAESGFPAANLPEDESTSAAPPAVDSPAPEPANESYDEIPAAPDASEKTVMLPNPTDEEDEPSQVQTTIDPISTESTQILPTELESSEPDSPEESGEPGPPESSNLISEDELERMLSQAAAMQEEAMNEAMAANDSASAETLLASTGVPEATLDIPSSPMEETSKSELERLAEEEMLAMLEGTVNSAEKEEKLPPVKGKPVAEPVVLGGDLNEKVDLNDLSF